MKFQLKQVFAPIAEPVTLADVKTYLRIDGTTEDALITELIGSARGWVERTTGRSLTTQTWLLSFDAWPEGRIIYLPRPPLQAVNTIKVYDDQGNATTLSSDSYLTDINEDSPRIIFKTNGSRPKPGQVANGIEIEFMAGYGDLSTDVPAPLAQAVKLLSAHWYENRELLEDSGLPSTPKGIEAVLSLYRSVCL